MATQRLGPFRGLKSAVAGDAPLGFAGSMLNARVSDGAIRPRYGYRNLAAAPSGPFRALGLARLLGYGSDSAQRLEWVSIEKRSGTVKPYSINPTTWARTEITNNGTPLALNESDWLGFVFNGDSYWVNPGGTPSLYKHAVGNAASWYPLQNATYTPVPSDPSFLLELNPPYGYLFGLSGDTVAVSGPGVSSPTTLVNGDSSLTVSGNAGNNSQNSANSIVTLTFGTPQDLSTVDYVGFLCNGEDVYIRFKTGVLFEVQIGGVWSPPEQQPFLSSDRTKTGVVARMKGVSGASAVQAVRFTLRAEPQPHHSGKAYTIMPLQFGGSYLGATLLQDRPWDATYKKATITYAARYKNVSTSAVTGVKQATFDASRFGQYDLTSALPGSLLGDRVSMEIGPLTSGGYSDDPTGASFQIEWLRLDQNNVWHVLGTSPNTSGQGWRDHLEERELQALPSTTVTGYTAPTPEPVFSSDNFVAGTPYKGWVVWFLLGGYKNVRHSRVGNAEALASPGDDVEDVGRGADFTLADDFADEPLGGVQAGGAILIAGRQGVYGQTGDYPSQMTPPRKAPGAMGCAGRFAFARFRDDSGNPGMAWLDPSGENVWFASTALVYSTDTQARPVELSMPIRGTLRTFLLSDQTATFPDLDISDARMDVDEATQTLWLFLGKRAAVLRPQSLIDGERQWELYEFGLGAAGIVPTLVAADPYGATTYADVARSPYTLAWSNPGNASIGSPVASCPNFLPGLGSHWLAGSGFVPWTLLPAEATVTSTKLAIKHRRVSSGYYPAPVVLSQFQSGALATSPAHDVPTSFETFEIDFASLLLDVGGVNAGIDARIAYNCTIPTVDLNPSHYTVTVNPSPYVSFSELGTTNHTQTFSFNVTYTGSGTPAPYVALNVTGIAQASGDGHMGYYTRFDGTASANNGLGQSDSGPVTAPSPGDPPPSRIASGTANVLVPLSFPSQLPQPPTVTMTASATVSGPVPQDATAFFSMTVNSVSPQNYAPATVEVESMEFRAGYTVPLATDERSIAYTAFGQRSEGLVWLRSSGHLDGAEWCPSCAHYVEGTNRDGGQAMPLGHWESARLPGGLRRLTRVETEREGFGSLSLVALCDRVPGGERTTVPLRQRWARFSPRVQGRTFRLRVEVAEQSEAVRGLDLVFDPLAGPNR